MQLRDRDRLKVVAGINLLWWLPMAKVTTQPVLCLKGSESNEMRTSEVLRPIHIDGKTAEYTQKPEQGVPGIAYRLNVNAENSVLDKEKDSELMDMGLGKIFIFFKDNQGNYRFMTDARILAEAGTGLQNGKPTYTIYISKNAVAPAIYYTGTVTIETNGTAVLS